MGDASEVFDDLFNMVAAALKRHSTDGELDPTKIRNLVGYELTKSYTCACGKRNDFPQDPNQYMLFAMVGDLLSGCKPTSRMDINLMTKCSGRLPQQLRECVLGSTLPNE